MSEPELSPAADLVAWAEKARAAGEIAHGLAGTAFIPDSLVVWRAGHDPSKVKECAEHGCDHYDEPATVAQVSATLLTGDELGFRPMAALRAIVIIRGQPALLAIAARALVMQAGHLIYVADQSATRAVVKGRRFGAVPNLLNQHPLQESVWTIDRAKQLGVRGFGNPDGPWKRQPWAMLVARATAECARWVASDVLLGLPQIAEEVGDETPEEHPDLPPEKDTQPAGPEPETPRRRTARRRSSSAPASGGTHPEPAQPAAIPSGPAGTASGEGEAAAAPGITPGQRAALWRELQRLGFTAADREEALALVGTWTERDIGQISDLTQAEADRVLRFAADEIERRALAEQERTEREEGTGDGNETEAEG